LQPDEILAVVDPNNTKFLDPDEFIKQVAWHDAPQPARSLIFSRSLEVIRRDKRI
jgi:hypothetical protein